MPGRNSKIQKNTGACGKVKRQLMDHIAEKGCVGSFHHCLLQKPDSIQDAVKIQEAKAAVDKEWNKLKNNSIVGCQEVKTNVRSHPSGQEGWENSSPREYDGRLSLEERRTCKTLPQMQGTSCALGGQRPGRRRIPRSVLQNKVLQRLRWQRQNSWTSSQSLMVWLEKNVTQFQCTFKSK